MLLSGRGPVRRGVLVLALATPVGCRDAGPPVSPEEMHAAAEWREELGRRLRAARDSARQARRATPLAGLPFIQGTVVLRGADWIVVVARPGTPTGGETGRHVRATLVEMTGVFRRDSASVIPRPVALDSLAVGQLVSVWQVGHVVVVPPVEPLPIDASAVVIEAPARSLRRRLRAAV